MAWHASLATIHSTTIAALVLCAAFGGATGTFLPRQEQCQFQYFDQKIDHFGKHDGTFRQKYSVNTDYHEPGGPVFFEQGGEGALSCVVSDIFSIVRV